MTVSRWKLVYLVPLSLCLASPALAGRPFITEDAGVLEPSDCEWESVAARSRVPGEARHSSLGTQIGCGIGLRSQLALNIGLSRGGGERARSLGLGGKTSIWRESDEGPALTLAWSSSWSHVDGPGGSREWDGAGALLAYSQAFADGWSLHANLSHLYSRAERRSRSGWALLVERGLSAELDAGLELFGDGSERPGLGLGLRWRPAERWTLDGSLARSGSRPRERLISLGLKLEF